MKSGNAEIVQFALDAQNDWNRFTSGGVVVKNCSPNHATAARAMAIQTPETSSTSSNAASTSATLSGVKSGHFGKVTGCAPGVLRDLVRGLVAADDGNPFVDHRNKEDEYTHDEGQLRDPYRKL